ncbi:hypothetical protein H310_11318 [Aphanomyces invadans]|uniref:J domain-containing protein n=1 Tax=Aphanomyces invadans TaxID=157072 RepID=A0A024TLH1_9STRA|nr:hypothetical protein H310_11318 [Aphanomyces invadans]ETV94990.1 hypothetical protein H310_11318 [Aphanomyces invadans]|eukprot:XP_008876163.1 hypothetical protein H310_11318 [Aphanomyces invadans]
MAEVERILKARTYYHVMGFHVVQYVEQADVRRQYKALARQVHPDKCPHKDAEDAFKRLSAAYECLANDTLQNEYLAKTTGSKKRPRQPSTRATATRPSPPTTSKPTRPKTPRTADDIYAEFLREEERQAEMDFHKRGFERIFDPIDKPRPLSPPPVHSDEFVADVLSSGLDMKQTKWSQFASSKAKATTPSASPVPNDSACCLLCRRKFPSAAHLARHKAESKLHAANVAKLP